jgi:hypothetical protein
VDGKLDPSDGVASSGRPDRGRGASRGDVPLLFGIVTFACLLVALTLSAYGHRPVLMLPIAIVCAIVFIRHGDGREHWRPASAKEPQRRDARSQGGF